MPGLDDGEEFDPSATADPLKKPQSAFDIIERLAKIIALIAIPIVIPLALAIYGARVQHSEQEETINRDYVQLAVSILKERKSTVNADMRNWAIDLLAARSPTKFSSDVIRDLKEGRFSFFGNTSVMNRVGAVTDDGKISAFALANKVVLKWHTGMSGNITTSYAQIAALDFSPNGKYLAIGSTKGDVQIVNIHDENDDGADFETDVPITSLRYARDGKTIRVASFAGDIFVYDLTGKLVKKLSAPFEPPVLPDD